MNIINDLKSLSLELQKKFNSEIPFVEKEKIISNKKEFVLDADIFSQDYLTDIAAKYHPKAKVISEELNNYDDILNETNEMVIMDPLDGTHNYLYGLPMWGFSYTFFSESGHAVESYIGLPMMGTLLCYKNKEIIAHNLDNKYEEREINICSTNKPLSNMMICFDNQFNKNPQIMKSNFDLLIDHTFTTRISGSAIFDIAMIVAGRLDARIWHCTEPYDVAPAYAFLSQSGFIINLNNGKKSKLTDKSIIASLDKNLFNKLESIGFQKVNI